MKEEKNILNKNLKIEKTTEEKLNQAYDTVRAKCSEKQCSGKIPPVRKRFRTAWAAAFAAALLSVSGVGVLAASGYFSKQVEKNKEGVTYTFDLNYELAPVDVTAEPSYLPEGMTAKGEGRFGHPDTADGFTVTPLTMVNLDEEEKEMSFRHIDHVRKTTIQNMEAHILTSDDEQKYHHGKDIFLFNPSDGYVIWIYGDYSMPLPELEKVAENLKITVDEHSSLKYDAMRAEHEKQKAAGEAWEAEMQQLLEKEIAADDITPVGEERYCESSGCGFTVEEVTVADSLYDLSAYTKNGVSDPEELTPWLNEDGTHKSYLRVHYSGEGDIISEEETNVKFMQVKVTAHQYTGYKDLITDTPLQAQLVPMVSNEDGTVYHWYSDCCRAVPSENYELQTDNTAFFLDQTEKSAKDSSFFFRAMNKDESLTYHLIFAVDEDWLTDGKPENLLLNFDGTGNDPLTPMYSALSD